MKTAIFIAFFSWMTAADSPEFVDSQTVWKQISYIGEGTEFNGFSEDIQGHCRFTHERSSDYDGKFANNTLNIYYLINSQFVKVMTVRVDDSARYFKIGNTANFRIRQENRSLRNEEGVFFRLSTDHESKATVGLKSIDSINETTCTLPAKGLASRKASHKKT